MNADEPNPYAPPAVTMDVRSSDAPLPPGVRRFTLDPPAYDAFQRRMLVQVVLFFAVIVAVMTTILVAAGIPLDKVALIFALAVGWVAVARFIRVRMARRANLESYELLVGEQTARRNLAGFVSAEIVRREIDDIVEVPTGLWLRCVHPPRSLFVARAIGNYAEARAIFESWRSITKVGGFAAWSYARREGKRQGPRDYDPTSTLQGHGPAVAETVELLALRNASRTTGLTTPPSRAAALVRIVVVWFGLIFFFLAIWQFFSSSPR
ncbi:MAG TPA: hypothetical protein VF407_14730 [Polyangiaceae bacterium]